MIDALNKYETARPEEGVLIKSSDQFYGFSSGSNRLQKHLQWVYVPAVKDVTAEQTESRASAFGKLLLRTVRSKINFGAQIQEIRDELQARYGKLLTDNQESLKVLSDALGLRLRDWAHPDARVRLEWRGSSEKSIRVDEPLAQLIAGEGDFEGDLSRFGHGLQRCYLLALLQELSGNDDSQGPRLVLGCEEPELHQHPPQARHLADVLFRLSKRNSQVIVTSHSPLFVSGERFEDVRMIRRDPKAKCATVSRVTHQQLAETIGKARDETPAIPSGMALKMQQALLPSLNELFFTRIAVLVEGLEDAAYVATYLNLLELWEDFRRYGCHIVSSDSKRKLLHPLAIAKHLKIPTFVVFDSDGNKPDKNGSRAQHEKDNRAILRLKDFDSQDPFPSDTFWARDVVMRKSDIGEVVKAEHGTGLESVLAKVRAHFGNVGKAEKSSMFISTVLTDAWQQGMKSTSLEKLCQSILEFAKKPNPEPAV